jgi:Family of unknown function (DUF6636)
LIKERKMKTLAFLLFLSLATGGCGGESAPVVETAATPHSTTAALTRAVPTAHASCDGSDILPLLQEKLGASIVKADVVRCRNGYARVQAVPDMSTCPPTCYDTAEIYLRSVGTRWRILDVGTGIPCEDTSTLPPLPALDRRACRALGYFQPTIIRARTFQMPSRNIGCALVGTALRCDVRSGLKPEPNRPCQLDWVGLVLTPGGRAEPNCAGNTIYRPGAPTLAYGALWHRATFWCHSRGAGLLCFNPSGEGSFQLSRDDWEG